MTTMLINSKNIRFILRIYRNDWRSAEDIRFELGLLSFLGEKAAPVSFPLRTKTGELSFNIDSPQGTRTAALFRYAEGHAPGNEISVEESALLGNTVAKVHQLTEHFHTPYNRPILDTPYLLDEAIIALEPFIDAEAHLFLETLQNKLHRSLPALAKEQGQYGICTGDVNPTNFHIHGRKITLFDFDQCGYGYRAFEIGKFISSIHSLKTKQDLAQAFIDGYRQIRQLSREEIRAIPYFEMVSVIWVMSINANNADLIGHKWLGKPFWDQRLAILKKLDNALIA